MVSKKENNGYCVRAEGNRIIINDELAVDIRVYDGELTTTAPTTAELVDDGLWAMYDDEDETVGVDVAVGYTEGGNDSE